ncbi:YadA C-terminal domain-containing protein [Vibrio sinaloensis]|uniref:YadA C-terminal domain-containing protein n=1 Tax=Photobacterium sp. (strain ATCC 43367) TaxID=379097 RepID=UPI000693B21C|nr:YadA C-terminal domain-containing protein [Vibrio sinaloensis]
MKKQLLITSIIASFGLTAAPAMAWYNWSVDDSTGVVTDSNGNTYTAVDSGLGDKVQALQDENGNVFYVKKNQEGHYEVFGADGNLVNRINGDHVDFDGGFGLEPQPPRPEKQPPMWGGDNTTEGKLDYVVSGKNDRDILVNGENYRIVGSQDGVWEGVNANGDRFYATKDANGDWVVTDSDGNTIYQGEANQQAPTQPPVDNSPDRPSPEEPSIEAPINDDVIAGLPRSDVDDLRADFEAFAAETNQRFLKMEDRMDQVGASLHATVNARPMVANGQTAFGAGVGFAGDVEAVAIGVAHSFEGTGWSVSGTVNYASGTKNISSDVMGGAGVQFSW